MYHIYKDYKEQIKPFDLLLFKGGDVVSDLIRVMEKRQVKNGDFSHAAVVMTSEVINEPSLKPGVLYTWEMTMSGNMNDGVQSSDNRSFLGIQFRELDKVVEAVNSNDKSEVAVLHLLKNPWTVGDDEQKKQIANKCYTLWQAYKDAKYVCPCTLVSALDPKLRTTQKCCYDMTTCGTKRVFCSQWVAIIYKTISVLPKNVRDLDVLPVDFIKNIDQDHQVSGYVGDAVYLVDTIEKIAKKSPSELIKIVTQHVIDSMQPQIKELTNSLQDVISALQPHSPQSF